MLNVLGAGCAYPDTILSNSLIEQLRPDLSPGWILQQTGIESRHSILESGYLKKSSETDPWDSKSHMLCPASELSLRAAHVAIERAGINAADIGLVLGETSTPFQTAPSEAQRVGGKLGLKVPAYDVASGAGSLPLHLGVLNSWKSETIPDLVLCVSCNVPTQRTDYTRGSEGIYFGDAATALVVSPRKEGGLKLVDSYIARTDPAAQGAVSFDLYGITHVDEDLMRRQGVSLMIDTLRQALSKGKLKDGGYHFIGEQINYRDLLAVCEEFGISESRHWSNVRTRGYSLGSSAVSVLAENWGRLAVGESLVAVHACAGLGSGYVVFEA